MIFSLSQIHENLHKIKGIITDKTTTNKRTSESKSIVEILNYI